MDRLQHLLDRLNDLIPCPSAILDTEGNILAAAGWQEICTQFHRKHPGCEGQCRASDQYILSHIHEANPSVTYCCPRGLMEAATPILIDGVQYATFFAGQFFLEKPDLDFHKQQAKSFGFDETTYLKSIEKVPIISRVEMDRYLRFAKEMIDVIADGGRKKLKEVEASSRATEGEEYFNTILHKMHDGLLVTNATDGLILDTNEAMCALLGYSQQELLSMSIADLEMDHSTQAVQEKLVLIRERGSAHFETRYRRKDGVILNIEVSVTHFPRSRIVFGLHRDITERKKNEEALRAASHYSRSLIEASLDPLVTISPDGKITDVNKATEKITGMGRLSLIGSDFADYFTEPDMARAGYQRVFEEGHVIGYPLAVRHVSGAVADVLYNASVYRNERGEVLGVFAAARDITKRKRAEEALRAASHYSRSLIEASLDPLVTISADGKITDVNKATEKITGIPREKLIGSDFANYFTEPDMARAGYRKVFDQGQVIDYPLAVRHASGKITNVLYNASVYRNDKGNVLGVFAAARDITARKQAEEALQAASHYSRSLIEASLDPLVTISADGKITDVNKATEKITGMGRLSLIGSDFTDYVTEPDMARAGFQEVFNLGQVLDYPLAIRNVSGEITHVLYNASLYKNEAGEVLGVFAAARDITARKKAEEALRAASHYSRSLIEASLDPLVTISADGKITDVNKATEKITGLSRNKLIGSDFANYFTEPDMAREGYRKVFEQGHVIDYPLAVRNASGAIVDMIYNASIYRNDRGQVLGVFAAARDITARKKAEEAKEKLQLQKAESLSRMAGAIAHHFNNQLQVVMMNLSFATKSLAQGGNIAENLAGAMQSARKAAEVSSQMLTYLGQTNAKCEPMSLSEACRKSLSLLRSIMPINVTVETAFPSLSPYIESDPSQIHQIISNLVTNAWEACSGKQGVIRIAIKITAAADIPTVNRFPVGSHPRDSLYACLEIADNGCGIADKYMENLFDPFFSSKFTGRGLGLPMVLGIARAHRGYVTVLSEQSKGSTFCVFIPSIAEAVFREKETRTPLVRTTVGGTVLVVDDEISLRKALATAVKLMGFSVLEAEDGIQAMEIFRMNPHEIRLVICDLTMPRMDGWQTLSELRKIAPEIPVILASGYNKTQALSGNHGEMPQAFLSKPYEYDILEETILQILSKRGSK